MKPSSEENSIEEFPSRGKSFFYATLFILLAFTIDTTTTFLGGKEARLRDLNPLIRNLSDFGYLLLSVLRFLIAYKLLSWFWPKTLQTKFSNSKIGLLLPFCYQYPKTYFIVTLILLFPGIKIMAAISNLFMLMKGQTPFSPGFTITAGMAVGIFIGNGILYYRFLENKT